MYCHRHEAAFCCFGRGWTYLQVSRMQRSQRSWPCELSKSAPSLLSDNVGLGSSISMQVSYAARSIGTAHEASLYRTVRARKVRGHRPWSNDIHCPKESTYSGPTLIRMSMGPGDAIIRVLVSGGESLRKRWMCRKFFSSSIRIHHTRN